MSFKTFWVTLKYYRRGLLMGAGVGAVAAYYAISKGIDLNSIATSGQGLIDSLVSRSAPLDLAKYKLYGVFMSFGAAAGLVLEMLLDRIGIGRRSRIRRRR